MNRWNTGFETILCDTEMVDTKLYAFVKIHELYRPNFNVYTLRIDNLSSDDPRME